MSVSGRFAPNSKFKITLPAGYANKIQNKEGKISCLPCLLCLPITPTVISSLQKEGFRKGDRITCGFTTS
jgi:hypothetical protein